jgi:hypothetical protein
MITSIFKQALNNLCYLTKSKKEIFTRITFKLATIKRITRIAIFLASKYSCNSINSKKLV